MARPTRAPAVRSTKRAGPRFRFSLRRLAVWIIGATIAIHIVAAVAFAGLRYINPPSTGVQIQRRVASWFASGGGYSKNQEFRPLSRIAIDLQHAVIAAEDGRFFEHHGIDWNQVRKVAEQSAESGEISRGASTITQQLVKNLFFTTHRNPVRKAFEYTLAPMADAILGKQRTLELYINVVEWGPGVFGAEAAAQHHFRTPASRLTREQSARLAAILPAPRRRKPMRMNRYSASIQTRMQQMGW